MSHTCQALILNCMDFRFVDAIHNFATEQGLKDNYDSVALAGSAKDIVEKGEDSIIMTQIDISSRLHGIKKVYLIHHEDCGAYGGKKSFESDEVEMNTHKDHTQLVADLIKQKFSNLEVIRVFAYLKEKEGNNVISFEIL